MTTSNNFYIIDEYSKHDVVITEYNAEDYTGWYRVIYDEYGNIKIVVEITPDYIKSVGLTEIGETWTLTKWFTTSKDNEATLDVDESITSGVNVNKENPPKDKYFIDKTTDKEIYPVDYENYIGWYRVIRDNEGTITDIIEITKNYICSIYFNDPIWEVTKHYRINEKVEGFIFNSTERKPLDSKTYLSTEEKTSEETEELSATEKLKAKAIKYTPKVDTVLFTDTIVSAEGTEYSNPYKDKTPGVANRYGIEITVKRF